MTMLQKTTILILLLTYTNYSFSQKKNIDKANNDFDRFAYIDAREIYLKVIEDGYGSAEIYKKLGDTYYFNSDYKNASDWYRRLLDKYPNEIEPKYYYRTAQSLKSINEYEESDKLMQVYAKKGGKSFIVENFKKNPDYLKKSVFNAKKYKLDKVSINTPFSDFGPSFYLDKLDALPEDLENYVLKPLYSFAGSGVQIHVTREMIEKLPNKSNYILQEKVKYHPIVRTLDEPAICEIRMILLRNSNTKETRIVSNLMRLSKGEMIGVKYNKDKTWVGGSTGFFEI